MNDTIVFNKKAPFTVEADFPKGKLDKTPAKVISLKENPTLDAGWEPIEVAFHDDGSRYLVDGEYKFDMSIPMPEWEMQLFAILANIYDFGSELFKNWTNLPPHEQMALVQSRLGIVILTECSLTSGEPLQEWKMEGAWPHSVNFGELCYSSDPSTDIEVAWRFQKCTHTLFNSAE